jgi:hypothetical protein
MPAFKKYLLTKMSKLQKEANLNHELACTHFDNETAEFHQLLHLNLSRKAYQTINFAFYQDKMSDYDTALHQEKQLVERMQMRTPVRKEIENFQDMHLAVKPDWTYFLYEDYQQCKLIEFEPHISEQDDEIQITQPPQRKPSFFNRLSNIFHKQPKPQEQ